jgi:hypothetical protein
MSFNKKYYKQIKFFVDDRLRHRPWCMNDTTIMDHILMIIGLIPGCLERQDFEAAQAVKDSIIEFINTFPGEKIDRSILLRIPPFKPHKPFSYHLSYINPKTKL